MSLESSENELNISFGTEVKIRVYIHVLKWKSKEILYKVILNSVL